MVLSMPVQDLQGVGDRRAFAVKGVREYHCEEVSMIGLVIDVDTSRDGVRKYTFSGALLVGKSYDRLVNLTFTLTDGGVGAFGKASQSRIHAEEEGMKRFSTSMLVHSSTAKGIDLAKALTLTITVSVQPD